MKLTSPTTIITTLLILIIKLPTFSCFSFASITVEPDSKTINTLTRYKFTYDRTTNDSALPTPYTENPIVPTDTITVTFPNTYTLTSVSCTLSINGGTQFTPTSCTISGYKVIAAGVVSTNTYITSVVWYISNIINPSPAITTEFFYGSIGGDVSGTGYYASSVILQAGIFTSCSITFNTTTVNSTSDMILSIVPKNTIGSAGSIKVQFPSNRRWTNDISTTNLMPISSSMSCSSRSSNVKSTFQCVGDSQAAVWANLLFDSAVSGAFSFSINGFLSPPTQQATDGINITSYISGSPIDTCIAYPSGLTPKIMTNITIASSTGSTIIINKQYSLRFSFILPDTLAQNDTITLVFPSGSIFSLSVSNISSNFSVNPNSTAYDVTTTTMNLFMTNQGRTFGMGSLLVLTVGTYTAPPSTQPTDNFVLTFWRGGHRKIQGTTTLTATASTLTATSSITTSAVNAVTTYTIVITTLDPLSSTGKIKIVLPPTVSVSVASPTCATLTGTSTGISINAQCTFNTQQNSITLSSFNSTSSTIPPQTITITLSGIKNPSSTSPTSSFIISTYYKSTDISLVATGTAPGITATTAIIDAARMFVTATSDIVNDQNVSYSVQLNVVNPIPAGGYIVIYVPPEIGAVVGSIAGHCSINVNATSYVPTSCTATLGTNNGYLINFTNPFTSDLPASSTFIAKISSIFTNPPSTRPTSSFALYTYHLNGYSIASIQTSKSIQMNVSDSFQSLAITRSSQKNYQLNTYTFVIKQKSPYQVSSVLIIGFPVTVVAVNPVCMMVTPVSTSLGCTFSSSTLRVPLPASTYTAQTSISFTVTNIRNPPSFAPAGTFTFQSKTQGELYIYSYSIFSTNLSNSNATAFQSISAQFTPATYGDQTSLKITFDPSESGVIPSSLKFTLANSFSITGLACNSFDFTGGTCVISPGSYTIQITGDFTASSMTFSVTGFRTPLGAVTDFSSLVSFDAGGYRLDQSTNNIRFGIVCTLPCKTCEANISSCLTCYTNTLIRTQIYYDSTLKSCFQTCPDGKYQTLSPILVPICSLCDSNCLTCQTTSTFCIQCNTSTIFKYLMINTTTATQKCVSVCPATYYPDSSLSPTTCKACVSPCKQCNSSTICTSCLGGFFYYQGQCRTSCPDSITIANNVTNNCDGCDSNCLTCSGLSTTCTSCNQTLLLYLNQCRTSCPSPLVPQNGTCGACDSSCKTCSVNKFNCTSCDTTTTAAYLLNNLCLTTCPETYYRNIGAGLCSLCSSLTSLHCRNCSSSSTCLTCDNSYVYFQQSCLDYVPTGYVNISGIATACTNDCLTCSITTSNCTSCTNFNYFNYQCLVNCPTGYIPDNKVCKSCLSPCRTCQTTIDTCTSCLTTLNPSVFYLNNQCVETCPNGMYSTLTNYTCVSCSSPCQYCTSRTACTSCLNGFFLANTSCITVCPSGYTGVDRVCQVCLGNCATCTETTTKCTSCKVDTYYLEVSNSCVTSCGTGLFIDYLTRTCVTCSAPCKTCTNTSDTCLSCTTGILYSNQCLNQCPQKYFVQSNQCYLCPNNCSSCLSLVVCTGCAQDFVLYNGFCITECPPTDAVVINAVCTKCSTVKCHKCTSADFCINCQSAYSLLNGQCLSNCPSGYQTNGTHCIDTNKAILTASASFPVPFSIATVVVVIACLMSKLQFQHTFLSGAIYSMVSIIQWGALGYFLYLYFIMYWISTPIPFLVGGAAMAYLYLLNFLAIIIQNCTICYDKDFKQWYRIKSHKCITIFINFFALLINHKLRNILFCKMFTLDIFTAHLESNKKFKVINVFSFLSLLHSGAAIFAAVVAIQSGQAFSQFFYACVDVIVATGINAVLAFFNVMKPDDFFYERTPDGFQLKKRINIDDDYYQSKIQPEGKAGEDEEGFATNVYRTQVGAGFTTKQLLKIQSHDDFSDKDYSFGSLMEKQVEQVSIQALEPLQDKQQQYLQDDFQVVFPTATNQMPKKQTKISQPLTITKIKNTQTSIQATPILEKGIEQRVYNLEVIKQREQRMLENQSNRSLLRGGDRKKVFDSSSEDISYEDSQIKKQRSKNILYKPEFPGRSKLTQQSQLDYNQNEPSSQLKDTGVGSYRPIVFIQQDQDIKIMNRDNQKDEGIQINRLMVSNKDQGIQSSIHPIQQEPEMKQKNAVNNAILEEQEQYNIESTQKTQSKDEQILEASKKNELILPKENIEEYQKQLRQKINAKNQQLDKMKKKIQTKTKNNEEIKNMAANGLVTGRLYRKSNINKNSQSQLKQSDKSQAIVQQIEVVDHIGQKKIINVEFNDEVEKQSEEDFIAMVQDHPEQLIFQQVQDDDKAIDSDDINLRLINPNNNKGESQILLQPEQQQIAIKQSQGEITSANDPSTHFKANGYKRGGQTDGTLINVDEIDQSIAEESDGIHQRPKDLQNNISNNLEAGFSQTLQTNDIKKTRQFGQYSHRPQTYNKDAQQINNPDGRISTPLKTSLQPQPKKYTNIPKANPLKTINRFEFQNEDRNRSESGQDQFSLPFRARLMAPFETDKQETEFKNTGVNIPQKIVIPRQYKNNIISVDRSRNTQGSNDDYQYKVSPNKRSFVLKMQDKQTPLKSKKYDMEFGPPDRQEPYTQQNQSGYDHNYKNNSNTNSKLIQEDDELKKYYQRSTELKKSRSKSKKKPSQAQLHAEKIYMQRQDVPKRKR